MAVRDAAANDEFGRESQPDPSAATGISDVGASLRDARERRGLSLDQMSRTTKIPVASLRSIEQNRIASLPNRVFLRGFLNAYAREVGLDPQQTIQQYLDQFEPATEIVETARPRTTETSCKGTTDADSGDPPAESSPLRPGLHVHRGAAAAALVAIVFGSYAVIRWRNPAVPGNRVADTSHTKTTPSGSPMPSPPAAAARPETATAGSLEMQSRPATDGDVLRLELRSRGICWVAATVDGTQVVYRLMRAGDEQSIEIHDQAVLRVGDPAAFTFSINGRAGRSLGRTGEAVTVHITRQSYRELLQQ